VVTIDVDMGRTAMTPRLYAAALNELRSRHRSLPVVAVDIQVELEAFVGLLGAVLRLLCVAVIALGVAAIVETRLALLVLGR
jgi:hypothetical protein